MIINAFKDKVFPLNPEESFPEYKDREKMKMKILHSKRSNTKK